MATAAPTRYETQREKLASYFDGTARKAWIDLTSDAPVSGIRATVRAGRETMRETLLGWLPQDLRRTRLLDAGCGTGALAVSAAWRGADVVGIDIAAGLIEIARERSPGFLGHGKAEFHAGDMLDPAHGEFDHIVAMDSLIHYNAADIVEVVDRLGRRCRRSMVFTFAPRTMLLGAMHTVGRRFPRSDRAPAIQPVSERELRARLGALDGWEIGRTKRVKSGFYTSQAIEMVRR